MKLLSLLCLLAVVSVPVAAQAPKPKPKTGAAAVSKSARTIEIVGSEQMKYSVTTIHARPNEQFHVVLKSVGTMPKMAMAHNFVLLTKDASPLEVNNAALTARETDFVPPSMKDKIIASTALAGGGETVEVTFAAPSQPGSYTYLCTFPGHFTAGMKGELIVR